MKIFEANLTSGSSYIKSGLGSGLGVSWLKTLGTNEGSQTCNLQGVVKLTFPPSLNGKQNCRLKFDLHLLKDLSKGGPWNFDIADSTGNGFGGDAGQTSNSAEVHNYRGSFYVYSNNLPGYAEYSNLNNLPLSVDLQANVITNKVTVTIGDEYVHFDNHRGIQRCYDSP